MKKYSIAEILHYAADNCLASEANQYWLYGGNKEKYSCCAVDMAYMHLTGKYDVDKIYAIKKGLSNMGCPVNSTHALKDEGKFIEENQQTRYAWLKFAAMLAEEQGV